MLDGECLADKLTSLTNICLPPVDTEIGEVGMIADILLTDVFTGDSYEVTSKIDNYFSIYYICTLFLLVLFTTI